MFTDLASDEAERVLSARGTGRHGMDRPLHVTSRPGDPRRHAPVTRRRRTGHDMKSKALTALTALLLSVATGAMFAAPSYAGTMPHSQDKTATPGAAAAGSTAGAYAGPLCEGWGNAVAGQLDPCSLAPYTTHNFQNELNTSYWGMPVDDETVRISVPANCTNYAAFVESTVYGVPAPKPGLPIDAMNWASGAMSDGYTVNHTPTVGSVAQWYANDNNKVIGAEGHVAVVEQVGPNDSYIVISQDNWESDTDYYGWAKILNGPDTPGAEPWPDNFIHFRSGGQGAAATLSYTQPDRLLQSTGNLYWTADQTVDGMSQADVYRASKSNEPGQEQILYQESASTPVDFEAITYANVGGTWYGYFVANYPSQNESQIKRVPLTGGAAVVLATSPAVIGNRDLVTDGSSLYWADTGGIRKMAITGGTVQTLVSGATFTHLGLDGAVLYYSSGDSILNVPTSGGASATVVSAASAITAIDPSSPANGILWGEANGSVYGFEGDIYYQLQAPVAGINVTSVSVAGNYIIWADCFPQWCQVDGNDSGSVVSVATSGIPVDVQGDAGAWYWGDPGGLEKFAI
jgi:surface antigen